MTTAETSLTQRLNALERALREVYEPEVDAKALVAEAPALAQLYGVTELGHLVYLIYSTALNHYDRNLAASVIAEYAVRAHDPAAPSDVTPEGRRAYIAAMTTLDLSAADRRDLEKGLAFSFDAGEIPPREGDPVNEREEVKPWASNT